MEHFYTIQGEGFHQGKAAYFIRLAGCDVGCHWCDVKESWQVNESQLTNITELLAAMENLPKGICVITGGEPSMYDLQPLTIRLRENGWQTHIETSGSHPRSGSLDWVCVSPKKFKAARPDWLSVADELKVVVYHRSDLKFAASFLDRVPPGCQLFLQPEWGREQFALPLILEYVKKHPRWQVSLQLHKYMGVE